MGGIRKVEADSCGASFLESAVARKSLSPASWKVA
jgi:hypothetical protein